MIIASDPGWPCPAAAEGDRIRFSPIDNSWASRTGGYSSTSHRSAVRGLAPRNICAEIDLQSRKSDPLGETENQVSVRTELRLSAVRRLREEPAKPLPAFTGARSCVRKCSWLSVASACPLFRLLI